MFGISNYLSNEKSLSPPPPPASHTTIIESLTALTAAVKGYCGAKKEAVSSLKKPIFLGILKSSSDRLTSSNSNSNSLVPPQLKLLTQISQYLTLLHSPNSSDVHTLPEADRKCLSIIYLIVTTLSAALTTYQISTSLTSDKDVVLLHKSIHATLTNISSTLSPPFEKEKPTATKASAKNANTVANYVPGLLEHKAQCLLTLVNVCVDGFCGDCIGYGKDEVREKMNEERKRKVSPKAKVKPASLKQPAATGFDAFSEFDKQPLQNETNDDEEDGDDDDDESSKVPLSPNALAFLIAPFSHILSPLNDMASTPLVDPNSKPAKLSSKQKLQQLALEVWKTKLYGLLFLLMRGMEKGVRIVGCIHGRKCEAWEEDLPSNFYASLSRLLSMIKTNTNTTNSTENPLKSLTTLILFSGGILSQTGVGQRYIPPPQLQVADPLALLGPLKSLGLLCRRSSSSGNEDGSSLIIHLVRSTFLNLLLQSARNTDTSTNPNSSFPPPSLITSTMAYQSYLDLLLTLVKSTTSNSQTSVNEKKEEDVQRNHLLKYLLHPSQIEDSRPQISCFLVHKLFRALNTIPDPIDVTSGAFDRCVKGVKKVIEHACMSRLQYVKQDHLALSSVEEDYGVDAFRLPTASASEEIRELQQLFDANTKQNEDHNNINNNQPKLHSFELLSSGHNCSNHETLITTALKAAKTLSAYVLLVEKRDLQAALNSSKPNSNLKHLNSFSTSNSDVFASNYSTSDDPLQANVPVTSALRTSISVLIPLLESLSTLNLSSASPSPSASNRDSNDVKPWSDNVDILAFEVLLYTASYPSTLNRAKRTGEGCIANSEVMTTFLQAFNLDYIFGSYLIPDDHDHEDELIYRIVEKLSSLPFCQYYNHTHISTITNTLVELIDFVNATTLSDFDNSTNTILDVALFYLETIVLSNPSSSANTPSLLNLYDRILTSNSTIITSKVRLSIQRIMHFTFLPIHYNKLPMFLRQRKSYGGCVKELQDVKAQVILYIGREIEKLSEVGSNTTTTTTSSNYNSNISYNNDYMSNPFASNTSSRQLFSSASMSGIGQIPTFPSSSTKPTHNPSLDSLIDILSEAIFMNCAYGITSGNDGNIVLASAIALVCILENTSDSNSVRRNVLFRRGSNGDEKNSNSYVSPITITVKRMVFHLLSGYLKIDTVSESDTSGCGKGNSVAVRRVVEMGCEKWKAFRVEEDRGRTSQTGQYYE